MKFKGLQKTFKYKQINTGNIDDVFPLLCPVREKDWIDGWDYEMIHSHSGLIEKNCVFSTPNHGSESTTWHVTQFNKKNFTIEFLRMTPDENVVRINIELEPENDTTTICRIAYQYTALNEDQNVFIQTKLGDQFESSMIWWEKAINHYLKTGQMLKRAT
ncbi:MAG: hypothetical protein GY816_14955 [Cytophagales bacterium]|nr:hypothetical protein [Cytophagales bacterium]